ncbi:uncharacterized protein LOC113351596 [Papaver somniferum]|uniref:uncharacterized protein LOC113351596 n=1 Tax=Papaver somniferum TaxID=3469 RepID=UPI000E705A92|nr:uncharacterized protein LOC113351596 [Papaver somniferum]
MLLVFTLVVGGDFNEIRFYNERSSGGACTNGMERFNRSIATHELIDLPLMGATYTWNNNQVQNIRSRIDGFLVSPEWETVYPTVTQIALSRPCSHHCPLALLCEGFILCKKLQALKEKLKIWSKEEFGQVDRQLEDLEEIFTQLDAEEDANNGLTEAQWNQRLKARQDYCNLVILEAESRAKVETMKGMDKNTKNFHKIASYRRSKNHIAKIKVNGQMTMDQAEIKGGIVD